MKRILKILVSIVIPIVVFGFFYRYQDTIRIRLTPLIDQIITKLHLKNVPCAEPIPYTLGSFDTRFNISQKYFLNALGEAEMIWEKPFGKDLFQYNNTDKEDGKGGNMLKINLIYDYRQQATSKLASLGIIVKDNRNSYDTLKIKFFELKKELTAVKSDYNVRVQSFNAEQKTYEELVKYWNMQDGAPQKEYDKLQLEKSALNMQVSQLQALQTKINGMVTEINAIVVVLNRLVGILNISVDEYNTIGASRGESFSEGVYSLDGSNREIDIYEFSNRAKLVRVLAHELGHALGLEHSDDTKAIMYELNHGNNENLTTADLVALKTKCGVK